MSRHNYGNPLRPWSKLKSRVEALFVPGLPLAVHCNVFTKTDKHFTFDEPRHWILLGHGRTARIIWDFPGPFLRHGPNKTPRSNRGPALNYWEDGYGWNGRKPSEPSALMRDYLDRPVSRLWEPFEDPWELGAILRAADRRLGRHRLLEWARELDCDHPALEVIKVRFGLGADRPSAWIGSTPKNETQDDESTQDAGGSLDPCSAKGLNHPPL